MVALGRMRLAAPAVAACKLKLLQLAPTKHCGHRPSSRFFSTATPNSGSQHLWVQLRGAARPFEVSSDGVRNVDALLKKVKQECPHLLEHVDVPLLQLYQSEQTRKALRGDIVLATIGGITYDSPLYVSFDKPHSESAPVVTWKGPKKLLESTGCDWDFQDNGIIEALRTTVPDHFQRWKGAIKDKSEHPLFVVLGPPGTSKSRTLQEIPKLLQGMFDGELGDQLANPYVVNLTFENGHSKLATLPCDPDKELGVRLMEQLGVQSPDPQPTLMQATQELARAVKKNVKDMTIILTVDGIQGLPGDWKDTDSAFHRCMRVVADFVNGAAEAFVIGAVSCSTMVPGEATSMLATTRQKRVIITSKALQPVTRFGCAVFSDDLRLLVNDMGGLGAALAALEDSVKQWSVFRGDGDGDLSALFTTVRSRLLGQYPAYAELHADVIGAALTCLWIDPKVDFKARGQPASLCLCSLVTLEYNEDRTKARFVVPYVLLALKGCLTYNFDDYRERLDPTEQFVTAMHWKSFEEAAASFWHMKSHILPAGPITLGELHYGAMMTNNTKKRRVYSKPMKLARSERKIEDLDSHSNVDSVLLNADGASGPDVIVPLSEGVADKFFCAGQMKKFSQAVLTAELFEEERKKANAVNHFFIAITTHKAAAALQSPPDNAAIVDKVNYKDYFGPFAFRMFSSDIDLSKSSKLVLMQIDGMGSAWADAIVRHRGASGYHAAEDLSRIVNDVGNRPPGAVRRRLESLLPSVTAASVY